jgi:hypothetical protein
MHSLHDQLERVSASRTFRSSPKIIALLKFLATQALAGTEPPPTQRLIAAHVLALPDPESASAGAAVRMQAGRLRKLLDRYYAEEGGADPIVIELPLREYRLRFLRDGQPVTPREPPRDEAPVLAVCTTRLLMPEPMPAGLAEAFVRNVLAELGGHSLVTTVGPLVPQALGDGPAFAIDPRLKRPATFVLDTAVQAAGDHVRVLASLSVGLPQRQIWSQTYEFAGNASVAGRSMASAARRLAADVADECGAIVREILRATAGKPAEAHSAVEAMASLWRYWITGSPDDLVFARHALDHAVANNPRSSLALAFWAAAACQEYTSSLDPRARLPGLVVERVEAARRGALGHPWIEMLRGYALWLTRHPAGLAAVIDQLDASAGSPTFRGMLGALRISAKIDPRRGREMLAAAIAESPKPLLWFHLCAALHDFQRGDLDAADRELARIDAPSRPEPFVIMACVAAARGDLHTARGILGGVIDVLPEFPVVGEVILRRWLHDSHVDAIAAALEPLGIDWFHVPRIGIARG